MVTGSMLVPTMFPGGMLVPIMFRRGTLVLIMFQVLILKEIQPCKFVESVSTYTLTRKHAPPLDGEHEYRMSCICA